MMSFAWSHGVRYRSYDGTYLLKFTAIIMVFQILHRFWCYNLRVQVSIAYTEVCGKFKSWQAGSCNATSPVLFFLNLLHLPPLRF
jgi:hypothetical protein